MNFKINRGPPTVNKQFRPHSAPPTALLEAGRAGNWLPPEELLRLARSAADTGTDVTLSLGNLDHLDTTALQVLLALQAECRKHGKSLQLLHVSPALARWFACAGASHHLSLS
jgi:ABC-type transporter Mla MlaB component